MIKKLQIKIIAVILLTLLLVFSVMLLVLNLSVRKNSNARVNEFMESVIKNDGFMVPQRGAKLEKLPSLEMIKAGRFFYVKLDKNLTAIEINLDMMYDFTIDDTVEFIVYVIESKEEKGTIGNFSFYSAAKPYGRIIVFAERSIEIGMLEQLTRTSLWSALIVAVVILFLAIFLSRWIIDPVKTAFSKQRRFISDASHELKTPLTIIETNVDVLENELGENKRLGDIREQSKRMDSLVSSLLTLSRTDDDQLKLTMNEFSLSNIVLSTVLEFESLMYEAGKEYSYNIAENISYVGDEKTIQQLLTILIDNALRYSNTNGQISVSLTTNGNHKVISVFNTGQGIPANEKERIFERFYRIDESRTRETGGYGIGLSIAKAITEIYKGKIEVSSDYGSWVRFDVII